MVKGLVVFDYDGTLVDERVAIYVPTDKTKVAIMKLQKQGYLCVLATGRALSYIPQGAKDLQLDGYVTSNGAHVIIHDKVLQNDVFEADELQALIQYMEEHNINFVLEGAELCYVKDMQDEGYHHFVDTFKIPEEKFVKYQRYEDIKAKIGKITFSFLNREELEQAYGYLKDKYQCCLHRNCNTFDLGKLIIHKGVGVQAIMDHCCIPMDKTYAFGDGDNDVELLTSVKYGIAMEIHDPLLDEVAYMVTKSVKDEGIYEALKEMEVI